MKDIKGLEGRYAITEEGEVWGYPKKTSSGKWMYIGDNGDRTRMKLIMTLGIPASGKTTWAKEEAEKLGIVRVNKDDIRDELHDGVWSKSNEKEVVETQECLIREMLDKGHDVIVGNTNFGWEDRLRALADEYGADFEIKDFTNVPLHLCLERNAHRDKKVPNRVIKDMYYKYVNKAPIYEMGDYIICDIDGTLAHMEGRNPYDGTKVHEDIVDLPVMVVLDSLKTCNYKVVIVTARDGKYLEVTEKWLKDQCINYDHIFIRTAGDNREDALVKKEIYTEGIEPMFGKPLFVLDDRDRVVKMWRELGLKCLQCEPGDF